MVDKSQRLVYWSPLVFVCRAWASFVVLLATFHQNTGCTLGTVFFLVGRGGWCWRILVRMFLRKNILVLTRNLSPFTKPCEMISCTVVVFFQPLVTQEACLIFCEGEILRDLEQKFDFRLFVWQNLFYIRQVSFLVVVVVVLKLCE